MAIGVIGDIHLNLPAFRATVAGPLAGCSELVTTGDFLDRGPSDPDETLDELLRAGVTLLAGNHEVAYLGGPLFQGMLEERCVPAARRLRDLVLDGRLRAAVAVGEVLCVHGGVSTAFWRRHLRDPCGDDPHAIAATLNRWFLQAVARGDFRHPLFGALRDTLHGPLWADMRSDLIDPGLPPIRQAVGHVHVAAPNWTERDGGAVFGLNWHIEGPTAAELGHLVIASDERTT